MNQLLPKLECYYPTRVKYLLLSLLLWFRVSSCRRTSFDVLTIHLSFLKLGLEIEVLDTRKGVSDTDHTSRTLEDTFTCDSHILLFQKVLVYSFRFNNIYIRNLCHTVFRFYISVILYHPMKVLSFHKFT